MPADKFKGRKVIEVDISKIKKCCSNEHTGQGHFHIVNFGIWVCRWDRIDCRVGGIGRIGWNVGSGRVGSQNPTHRRGIVSSDATLPA